MNYQISVRQEGDKFVAGVDLPGAYQAAADTPLLALRKWIHYVGAGIGSYRNNEITLAVLAQRMGVSEALALEMAEIETFVPQAIASRGKPNQSADSN